eukprot:755413-Hanusia_phi.AAC.2
MLSRRGRMEMGNEEVKASMVTLEEGLHLVVCPCCLRAERSGQGAEVCRWEKQPLASWKFYLVGGAVGLGNEQKKGSIMSEKFPNIALGSTRAHC